MRNIIAFFIFSLLLFSSLSSIEERYFHVISAQADNFVASPIRAGLNVVDPDGVIWLVGKDSIRPYTSLSIFNTYRFNNLAAVTPINGSEFQLRKGVAIPPSDGQVYCPDQGNSAGICFLLSRGIKYPFSSWETMIAFGYLAPKQLNANIDFVPSGPPITESDQMHFSGTLIRYEDVVMLVSDRGLLDIPNTETFFSWGYSFLEIVPANKHDLDLTIQGELGFRSIGELNPVSSAISEVNQPIEVRVMGLVPIAKGLTLPHTRVIKSPISPQVYFLTEKGFKKPISSPEVLESYGLTLGDVEVVDPFFIDSFPSVTCVHLEQKTALFKLTEFGFHELTGEEAGSVCPYEEQRVEINALEFKNVNQI